jgi:phosphoenolpyruvate-protein phosphotransferase (PTS system enzyme I)
VTETTTTTGCGVSPGLACAPLMRMTLPVTTDPDQLPGIDHDHEVQRVRQSMAEVADQLTRAGTSGTADTIMEAGAAMAQDPELVKAAAGHIGRGVPTAHSVTLAIDGYCRQLEALGGYMAERVADLRDIRNRAVAVLLDVPMPGIPQPGHPFILTAEDLSPADTANLGTSDVVGLLTEKGGPTSHTAILARSLGLPAVVGCAEASTLPDGAPVILDGSAGTVEVHPAPARRREAQGQMRAQAARRWRTDGPGRTADGHPVALLSNIGTLADATQAAAEDSEGVGLFRTEFMFLGRREAPTLDEQVEAYTRAFTPFAGRTITVRTLDAGSDKPLPFLGLPEEDNPALGIRGLRVAACLPVTLETQLKALVLAQQQVGAQMRVMAPMVSTAQEAEHFAGLARSHGVTGVGVMIEVPAAALRARDLLRHVDFVSIGTNDLAQYTLAADRTAHALATLLDPWQPALLDLIAQVCTAAAELERPVGVCGEAASDPLLAAVLTGFGVTSLSMAARSIPPVRDQIAGLTREQCQRMAAAALRAHSPEAAQDTVQETVHGMIKNGS